MKTRVWDSSRLLPSHKGVGILRPDGDTAAGTLTGHAIGTPSTPALDPATVADVIGTGQSTPDATGPTPVDDVPEPLASVVAYLGADLNGGGREFIPTAELVTVLGIDRATFSRHLSDLGCRPTHERIVTEDGTTRQVRGYLLADLRTAVQTPPRAPTRYRG